MPTSSDPNEVMETRNLQGYILHKRKDVVVQGIPRDAEPGERFAYYCCMHGDYALEFHEVRLLDENDDLLPQAAQLLLPANIVTASGTTYIWHDQRYRDQAQLTVWLGKHMSNGKHN